MWYSAAGWMPGEGGGGWERGLRVLTLGARDAQALLLKGLLTSCPLENRPFDLMGRVPVCDH